MSPTLSKERKKEEKIMDNMTTFTSMLDEAQIRFIITDYEEDGNFISEVLLSDTGTSFYFDAQGKLIVAI